MIDDSSMPKTEEEWKKVLTPEQYQVLRLKDTEAPGSGKYLHEKRPVTQYPFSGTKRTSLIGRPMSANVPNRTFVLRRTEGGCVNQPAYNLSKRLAGSNLLRIRSLALAGFVVELAISLRFA
jgi:hypothetical protein